MDEKMVSVGRLDLASDDTDTHTYLLVDPDVGKRTAPNLLTINLHNVGRVPLWIRNIESPHSFAC